MEKYNNLAIIILAAGTSSRLEGKSKQLLIYKKETLLRNSVKKAIQISNNVFVVLAHKKEECENELKDLDINIIYNENYQQGMGSSLALGVNHTKDFDYTMVMLCDQPFIPLSHYQSLKRSILNENIIASLYGEKPKVPAIFPKKFYNEISKLKADFGAKELLKKEYCIKVVLEENYSIDIDTLRDVDLYLHI